MTKKEEKEQIVPLPVEMPTIEKIVTCPNCGGKVKVEFEIEMDAVIPALAGDLSKMVLPEMPEEDNEEDEDAREIMEEKT